MSQLFANTRLILMSIPCAIVLDCNSTAAQSVFTQECGQEYFSSVDEQLPDAIALYEGESLQSVIERSYRCKISLPAIEPTSKPVSMLDGVEVGEYQGLAYNSKSNMYGAYVDLYPEFSMGGETVVLPSNMIENWTSKGLTAMASVQEPSPFVSAKAAIEWTKIYGLELENTSLPDEFVQAAFLPPGKSKVFMISEPIGAEVYVSEVHYGGTRVEVILRNDRHDAVRFEMDGFKDCDLRNGAVVKRKGKRPISIECILTTATDGNVQD